MHLSWNFSISTQTHVYNDYGTQGSITIRCLYLWGIIWTIEHLTDTLAFKDHWSHDLHDFAERGIIFQRFIILFRKGRGIEPRPFR